MDTNQNAARAARRLLDTRIRTDWDWPNPPPPWSASDEELRNISQFRERYYATTSSPTSESETDAATGPYKFDSPDSVSAAMQSKAQSRKRKRKNRLESEMEWNEGLSCFVHRRDVWTGAASVGKYGNGVVEKSMQVGVLPPVVSGQEVASPGAGTNTETNPTTTSSSSEEETQPNTIPTVPITPLPEPQTEQIETLLPLPQPLLSGNPIRASITPKIYPEIYSKVVVSARTPSVPINLSDMTRALVQGWKDNGEWPPKSGPLDPLAGRKRGVGGGGRLGSLGGGRFAGGKNGGAGGDTGLLAHHPHVKKGVESVKRIFHIAGHAGGGGTNHIGSAANGG